MSNFHWYEAADKSWMMNESYLGNSCYRDAYLPATLKKTGLQFRWGPPNCAGFTSMWRCHSNNTEHHTWHFTILKNGTVLQHCPTQAVTKSALGTSGWSASSCLEANCVVVVFEGPYYVERYICRGSEGWYWCNKFLRSDIYTACDPDDTGDECFWAGTTTFHSGIPFMQAQVDAAIALARWLFFAAYNLGKPLENQNVWGASEWGDPIFELEPAPPPPIDIPWQWPVTGGYISQGWGGTAVGYECVTHRAIDIAGNAAHPLPEGTAIYPAAGNHGGRGCWVVDKGYYEQHGYWVRLRHSHSWDYADNAFPRIDTVYTHLREAAYVSPGNWITMSDRIGSVGQTGLGGVHLHLGVYEWPSNVAYDGDAINTQANLLGIAGMATMIAGCSYRKDPMQYLPST